MSRAILPQVLSGQILGNCPKCPSRRYVGSWSSSQVKNVNLKIPITLICLDCGHGGHYFMDQADKLPVVHLRHKSNGQLLGPRRKSKKKKPKGDPFKLKGQLALPDFE